MVIKTGGTNRDQMLIDQRELFRIMLSHHNRLVCVTGVG